METKKDKAALVPAGTKHLSFAGYPFYENAARWKLDKNVNLPIHAVTGQLDEATAEGFRKALAFYASTYSASHTKNAHFQMKHLLDVMSVDHLSDSILISYRSTLTKQTEYYLGVLKGFLKKWHDLGYPGVSKDVVHLLDSWTLKGNEKGDAVQRLDPTNGPLTDIELLAFNEGAVRAFEQDQIDVTDLAIALCASHTGRRPIQLAHLKLCDVLEGKSKNGDPKYILNIPRVKQQGSHFRTLFRQFNLIRDVWALLKQQSAQVVSNVSALIGAELPQGEQLQLPLFPDMGALRKLNSLSDLRLHLNDDRLHRRSASISATLQRIASVAAVYSERTGKPLKLSANRFRYTTGTRAAREGFGVLTIAELLDHSDTQNAGVYIKNIPDHARALDQAVAQQLAPYAQAFAGVLVDREADAKRGDDPTSRVRTGDDNVGTCGSYGFCGANVPIPCYTCMHFQPWLDGPHALVLDELIAERERIKQLTGDPTIAAVNDRTILAVSEVIQRCEARRQELADG